MLRNLLIVGLFVIWRDTDRRLAVAIRQHKLQQRMWRAADHANSRFKGVRSNA